MSERWEDHAIDSGGWCRDCQASAWVCQHAGVRALRRQLDEAQAVLEKSVRDYGDIAAQIGKLLREVSDWQDRHLEAESKLAQEREARKELESMLTPDAALQWSRLKALREALSEYDAIGKREEKA